MVLSKGEMHELLDDFSVSFIFPEKQVRGIVKTRAYLSGLHKNHAGLGSLCANRWREFTVIFSNSAVSHINSEAYMKRSGLISTNL